MSKEELIKLVKSQILLKKKLETRITELSNANTSLCQGEEVSEEVTSPFIFISP